MFFDYNLSVLWYQFDEQFLDKDLWEMEFSNFLQVDIFKIQFYAYIFCESKFASVTFSTFRFIF